MDLPFLVAAIVLVSFISLAQPTMWKGYGFGHGHSYSGHGHSQMGHGHSQMGHGHGHHSRIRYCYNNAQRGESCDTDKRCAWNKRECPNYAGCALICTDNPYNWCIGLSATDECHEAAEEQCHPDINGRLVCVDYCDLCPTDANEC